MIACSLPSSTGRGRGRAAPTRRNEVVWPTAAAARKLSSADPKREDRSMATASSPRDLMVAQQIAARGVQDPGVLEAMREVPRSAFVPAELAEFAHHDAPLPIAAGQTISQPYIVALMVEALGLQADDRVLEVGSGSGYAAAVMSRICGRVYAMERHRELVDASTGTLARLGYDNVEVRHGDGTLGWPEAAPFDAILVSAGGPAIPDALRDQVAIGGRIVIPVGGKGRLQRLVRAARRSVDAFDEEDLGPVAFVPLVGAQGWEDASAAAAVAPEPRQALPQRMARSGERFSRLEEVDLRPLLERIGDRRLVLIGEASHGTSEFYRMRARITRELIERREATIVAAEADWPDAARIDRWVRGTGDIQRPEEAFTRFPTWMWRNREVLEFVDWLHDHDSRVGPEGRLAGFYGLDLYSLYDSIGEVLRYLDRVDPEAARIARHRYGCLTPFQSDPAMYGLASLTDRYRSCEDEVVAMLVDLRGRRGQARFHDGESMLDVEQNARVAANAERYYRAMYVGGAESWNLRDTHMFETLEALLAFHGPQSKAVVWAHNSHLGDASATAMARRGELNLGQLVRERFADEAYLIGFGTDHGTVAAATDWDGPMEVKRVRPSHPDSYERLCHDTRLAAFLLPLGDASTDARLRDELLTTRLERAIGVIYRPETELMSHYFEARLPEQFDEWIWIDETSAVTPLVGAGAAPSLAEGHPFATLDR
jgi:protein-L-isoaspartate(D-aspartate) O-methyltransferase